jgi:hypothetical protein
VSDPTPAYSVPQPEHSGVKTAMVAGALVALVAANVYLYIQVDKLNRELSKTREQLMTEIANVRETSSVTTASNRRNLQTLKEQLDTARHQASVLAGQAKTDAVAKVDALARKVADEQSRQEKQMTSQISEVKQVATTATAKIAEVGGDVSTVRSEVASTKSELEKTISDLKKVTGDLGVQSGYIATNSKELSALKRLGERNYFEFNLGKTKQPQRVGDISLMLKRADPKRNRYTIEVLADDKATEKRDKTVNEPVQFLTAKGGRLPYEIVVNQVKKDQIVGYLATPKETVSRN